VQTSDICMIKEVHVCARVVMAATAGPKIKLGARNFDYF
jgi:hypothetical protein